VCIPRRDTCVSRGGTRVYPVEGHVCIPWRDTCVSRGGTRVYLTEGELTAQVRHVSLLAVRVASRVHNTSRGAGGCGAAGRAAPPPLHRLDSCFICSNRVRMRNPKSEGGAESRTVQYSCLPRCNARRVWCHGEFLLSSEIDKNRNVQ
jgi:hypothetical protein